MVSVQPLRSLVAGPHARALCAASGLVAMDRHCWVVADDEQQLAMFSLDEPAEPGAWVPLLDGALPDEPAARKAAKPDFESLALLPPLPRLPHGALLAAGSGSRPNRQCALLLPLDGQGLPAGPARALDLSALYAPLAEQFAELNIEGWFVGDGRLRLLQRGNHRGGVNACIAFEWAEASRWLAGSGPAPAPREIQRYELGRLGGVPLSFTDGCALPGGGWVFCAAAEDSPDSYADGACTGSALGVVAADGALLGLRPLDTPAKVEGVALAPAGGVPTLLMVTDADNRNAPAWLLAAPLHELQR